MKCAACGTRDVSASDHCHGCKQTICWECIELFGHIGDGAHALNIEQVRKWRNGMEKKAANPVKEPPRMAVAQVSRVANGWIVNGQPDYSRDRLAPLSETHVFTRWCDVSDFLQKATT